VRANFIVGPVIRLHALAAVAALAFATAAAGAAAQETPTAASLEGVWKVSKVVTTGAGARVDTHPQPGLQIIYRGYFSIVRDNGSEPRKPSPSAKDPTNLTDTDKAARYDEWAPFAASAGTYELRGDTLITHNIVAKQVRGVGLTEEATIRFEGADTFVATAKSPPGTSAYGRETTYTRVR
jgi:hypothetical protein